MRDSHPFPDASRGTERARLELTHLGTDLSLDDVFRRVCEISAQAINVERVGIWLFIDQRQAIRCADLFELSRNAHSSGAVLHVADFPTYFSALPLRKAVPAEVAAKESWTAELAATYMTPLGISSILDAGIFCEGELRGVICHEHVGAPREWTTEDRDFAGSVADLVALRIQSADTRELRQAFLTQQDRLAALEKSEALERLAAGVAHDLRNLLTVFLGQGELLGDRLDLPEDVRTSARIIVSAALRGQELARTLQEFAQPGEIQTRVTDPATLIREFLPVLQASCGGVRLALESMRHTGRILIDPAQFTRVLMNLVVNARDVLQSGDTISIALRQVDSPPGLEASAGRYVLLEVRDNGPGFNADTHRHIFDPYFTTKPGGTGLGLAIVKQVVERAGGFIRVDSREGEGSGFLLYFPVIGSGTTLAEDLMTAQEAARQEAASKQQD